MNFGGEEHGLRECKLSEFSIRHRPACCVKISNSSITSVSLAHFLLLNVLTAVTPSPLLHVGLKNHSRAKSRRLKKRTCQQLSAPSGPLGNYLSEAGERNWQCVCFLCECILVCMCAAILSVWSIRPKLFYVDAWTSFTQIVRGCN